jgi:hypothetical protein
MLNHRSVCTGRLLLACWLLGLLMTPRVFSEEPLPTGSAPKAIGFPHFPDRLHAVVWRNWQLVEPSRLAAVLQTTEENVRLLAESMGLPAVTHVPEAWRRRGYATLVRRNWHLLPYDQLLQMIDMTQAEFAEVLREDDFLFIKLGSLKPQCDPVQWQEPSPETRQRAAEIRQAVQQRFGDRLAATADPPFSFVETLSALDPQLTTRAASGQRGGPLRYIYSYFGTFGDPLIDASLDPYPDGLLQRLADHGINGVWLHVVLRQLAPGGPDFPEFGAGHEQRLATLNRLVERAKRYGISVYLYMNEPRAMPRSFFAKRPDLGGTIEGDLQTMCTSRPEVQDWIASAVTHVFKQVPDLGGVFTITASENLTNCASHAKRAGCPRCQSRSDAEIITEVNRVIERAVHSVNPAAKVICWDWGWANHGDASSFIPLLPDHVWLMSVSEWRTPIERGGIRSEIGEYSISAVGPGPRAERHWQVAKERGLKTAAKVQFNNSWELAALPYLPVMDLVAEHCHRLAERGTDGMMLSWSLGGYPSPNLRIAQRFAEQREATVDEVLDELAEEMYGPSGAALARRGWTALSRAFTEYPYDIAVVYNGPQEYGPANLLFAQATGYHSTMSGFPYDDLNGWRGPYPPEVFAEQFARVARGWSEGVTALESAAASAPPDLRQRAEDEVRLARAAQLHFASVANQARFVFARTALSNPNATAAEREQALRLIPTLLDDEIRLADSLFDLAQADSRIGFEATNHYFYRPMDLIEKVICCEHLRRHFADMSPANSANKELNADTPGL